jgi:PadR family transcriptional regulator AphA
MSLRYALLGLLADEPASGYDLTRRFEKALRRYAWHAQHSQIYPELSRLAADGLVAVAAEGARGRRTYAITEAGRTELRRWMLNPPDVFVVRNEFVLRMFLLSTLDTEDARALLHPLVDRSARELAALRAAIDAVDATTPPDADLPFGRLVAEYGLRSFQTLHDWAAWALSRIDRGNPDKDQQGRTPTSRIWPDVSRI